MACTSAWGGLLAASFLVRGASAAIDPYHPGHPAVHTTRLHRYDHRGMDSVIQAEAEWHYLASLLAQGANATGQAIRRVHPWALLRPKPEPAVASLGESGESGRAFLQLSPAQMQALVAHKREVAQKSSSAIRSEQGSRQRMVDASRRYDTQTVVNKEDHPVTTRLSSLMSQYVGPIGVGTRMECETCKPQEESQVWVVFDTGSTNIWVSSDLCAEGPCASKERHRYNHLQSLTYREPDEPLTLAVKFGTGEVSGPHAVDHFRIGPFAVFNQTFAMIEKQKGAVFEEVPFEGILGLAFPSMSANRVAPFFDTVISENTLEHNEFAFYFSKHHRAGNALLWGGVDPAFYRNKIEYFPVTDPYYWSIDLHSFSIGDSILLGSKGAAVRNQVDGASLLESSFLKSNSATKPERGPKAIVDTGTTYFTAEGSMFEQVTQLLPNAPCKDITHKSHPPIVYKLTNIAGQVSDFRFTHNEYMTQRSDGEDAECELAFMKIDIPKQHGPGMVLGEVFLRSYFAVFDRGNGDIHRAKVGFAPAAHTDDTVRRLSVLAGKQPVFRTTTAGDDF